MVTKKRNKDLVWAQILYLYIVPVLLLYFEVIPDRMRVMLLLLVSLLLFGIVKKAKWTLADFGIKRDFMKEIMPYFVFTIAGALFLFWLSKIVPHDPYPMWWKSTKFLLLFIPISILQEIAFRGILMNFLSKVFSSPLFIISLNSALFAFMHVIYLNSVFVLPMTFIAGVGFAWMYYKYKNLILISVSHSILNFIGVALGFFVVR